MLVPTLRGATSFVAIAQCVIEALARAGGREVALVLHDRTGQPALWIGDATTDPARARAELERADGEPGHTTEGAQVAPLFGEAGVIGMLRVRAGTAVDLMAVAAQVSIRIASLGPG